MYWLRHCANFSVCGLCGIAFLIAVPQPVRASDVESAERAFRAASAHYAAGRWVAAAKGFQKLCEPGRSGPHVTTAIYFLAESLLQSEQPGQARPWFEKYLALEPRSVHSKQALFRIGETAYLSGDQDVAYERLQSFVSRHRTDSLAAIALTYLGEIDLARGKPDDAEKRYEECLRQFPHSNIRNECRLGWARVLEERRDFSAAEALLEQALADREATQQSEADFRLAMLVCRQSRYDEAATRFQQHLESHPESEHRIEAWYWLARCTAEQRNWTAAVTQFRQAEAEAAEHRLAPAICFGLAEALRRSDQSDAAAEYYSKLVDQWPDCAWADDSLHMRLFLASDAGDHALVEALAHEFQQKYPASPLLAQVQQSLARSYLAQKRLIEAVQILGPLVATPAGEGSRRGTNWSRYYLAQSYWGLERRDESLAELEQLRSSTLEPALRQAVAATTFTYRYEQRNYRQAVAALEEFLTHDPAREATRLTQARLALGYAQLREWERVTTLLQVLTGESDPVPKSAIPYLQLLIEAASRNRQTAIAEQSLELIGSEATALDAALLQIVRRHREQNHLDQARQALDRFLRECVASPLLDEAHYHHARLLDEEGKSELARDAWEEFVQQHANSRFFADAVCRLAESCLRAGEREKVCQQVEPLLAADRETRVRCHALQLWMQAQASENLWEEIEQFARPKCKDTALDFALVARFWLAESQYRRGQFVESQAEWTRLTAQAAGKKQFLTGSIWLRRAQCLAQLRRWEEIEPILAQLESKVPDFRQQHDVDYLRGRCLSERREFAAARDQYEQVVRSAEGGRSETAAMAQWMIGESWLQQQKYEQAIAAFQRVQLYDYPLWKSAALLQEAKCFEQSGQLAQGLLRYSQVTQEYPDSKFAQDAAQRVSALQANSRKSTRIRK